MQAWQVPAASSANGPQPFAHAELDQPAVVHMAQIDLQVRPRGISLQFACSFEARGALFGDQRSHVTCHAPPPPPTINQLDR